MNILILQKNTGKAGAQNSLRRLLSSQAFRSQNVLVVTGKQGWFLDQIQSLNIPHISIDFPSSRSLYNKLIGNKIWSKKLIQAIDQTGFKPDILQANNHFEAPFLHLLRQHYSHSKTVAFIRDPEVDEPSYLKYQSNQCDIRIAVSQYMHDALKWDRQAKVFNNGVFENEIYPSLAVKPDFPSKWLVLGNPSQRKGWSDFLSALAILQDNNRLDALQSIVFTGVPSGDQTAQYQQLCERFQNSIKLEFVPFYENLGRECQNFDLVIQPSRSESFGMALLEACCTGVCVISSNTGVADKLILDHKLLFEPGQIFELVDCLDYALSNWQSIRNDHEEKLAIIRENFSVENNAAKVIKLYQELLG